MSEPEIILPYPAPALPAPTKGSEHPKFVANKWKKGQSGNPKGSAGEYTRCRMLCREHSADAAGEIIRLFNESEDDRVRYMAAQWCFEQAWGKAREYDPNADPENKIKLSGANLTREQRDQLRALVQAAIGPPVE